MDATDARPAAPTRSDWLDRLVDLHVLAANGDPAADAAAREWLTRDAEARRVWDEVQRTCDEIRGAGS